MEGEAMSVDLKGEVIFIETTIIVGKGSDIICKSDDVILKFDGMSFSDYIRCIGTYVSFIFACAFRARGKKNIPIVFIKNDIQFDSEGKGLIIDVLIYRGSESDIDYSIDNILLRLNKIPSFSDIRWVIAYFAIIFSYVMGTENDKDSFIVFRKTEICK